MDPELLPVVAFQVRAFNNYLNPSPGNDSPLSLSLSNPKRHKRMTESNLNNSVDSISSDEFHTIHRVHEKKSFQPTTWDNALTPIDFESSVVSG
jgi:hypothetical protein